MSYEITIKEVRVEKKAEREYSRLHTEDDCKTKPDEDGKECEHWGYVASEETERVAKTVYEQEIEELNVWNVIKAVNDTLTAGNGAGGKGGA